MLYLNFQVQFQWDLSHLRWSACSAAGTDTGSQYPTAGMAVINCRTNWFLNLHSSSCSNIKTLFEFCSWAFPSHFAAGTLCPAVYLDIFIGYPKNICYCLLLSAPGILLVIKVCWCNRKAARKLWGSKMCSEKSMPKAVTSVRALWLSQSLTNHSNATPSYEQDDIPKGRMLQSLRVLPCPLPA